MAEASTEGSELGSSESLTVEIPVTETTRES